MYPLIMNNQVYSYIRSFEVDDDNEKLELCDNMNPWFDSKIQFKRNLIYQVCDIYYDAEYEEFIIESHLPEIEKLREFAETIRRQATQLLFEQSIFNKTEIHVTKELQGYLPNFDLKFDTARKHAIWYHPLYVPLSQVQLKTGHYTLDLFFDGLERLTPANNVDYQKFLLKTSIIAIHDQ